jgi:kumamolisin
MGIEREDPTFVVTMEPPVTRYREGQLDVEWAGAMAPKADLIVYVGPDARNTSMIYNFNEAIARNEVDVITDSFAHREDSEPRAVGEAYDHAAQMAAALGITVVSASGDSAGPDVPSVSPYVTSVGGSELGMIENRFVYETAWPYSGSGHSKYFPQPWWQRGLPGGGSTRAVADVALNASMGYWYCFLGRMYSNTGTSFSSPVFGAMITVVNGARATEGKPPVGWLNSTMYMNNDVRSTFRDITVGRTLRQNPARHGWDLPTGLGAPDAEGLLRTLP